MKGYKNINEQLLERKGEIPANVGNGTTLCVKVECRDVLCGDTITIYFKASQDVACIVKVNEVQEMLVRGTFDSDYPLERGTQIEFDKKFVDTIILSYNAKKK